MNSNSFLKTIFLNDGLAEPDLTKIVNTFSCVKFKKGEFLFRKGKTPDYYFFIEKGFVRSYAYDTAGNDITTGFYADGQLVLEPSSFFLQIPLKENFEATEDVISWKLDFLTFQEMFHSIPSFGDAGRARLVANYFALKQRSISVITDSAKERYTRLVEMQPQIFQKASLKHIATYLGITDTSLSRIRRELVKG